LLYASAEKKYFIIITPPAISMKPGMIIYANESIINVGKLADCTVPQINKWQSGKVVINKDEHFTFKI